MRYTTTPMGRIDDSLVALEKLEDTTERALQLAGLLSTLFKLKGVMLVVSGQLAFDCYSNGYTEQPTLDLASFTGKLTPRMILEVMRGQIHAEEAISHWMVARIPIRFQGEISIINRELCRDFTTEYGVVKIVPAEEITADRILASIYPEPNEVAHDQARLLLLNGVTDAFRMDWTALHKICHLPEYRIGEELAQLRLAAKREADETGASPDHVGQPAMPEPLAEVIPPLPLVAPETEIAPSEAKPARIPSAAERAMNSILDGV